MFSHNDCVKLTPTNHCRHTTHCQIFRLNVFPTKFSSMQWMNFPVDGSWSKNRHTLVTVWLVARVCPALHMWYTVCNSSSLQYPAVPISSQVFNEKQVKGRWLLLSAGIPQDRNRLLSTFDDMERNLEQVLIWFAFLCHLFLWCFLLLNYVTH